MSDEWPTREELAEGGIYDLIDGSQIIVIRLVGEDQENRGVGLIVTGIPKGRKREVILMPRLNAEEARMVARSILDAAGEE